MTRATLKRVAVLGGVALAASVATFVGVRAYAAGIPDPAADGVLTYSGYLENPDGSPLTGKPAIAVNFWADAAMTGDPLCTGKLPANTQLQGGRFQVPLPKACATAVNDPKAKPDIWVDVQVDGNSLGATKLGAVPFALQAGHAADEPIVTAWKSYASTLTTSAGSAVTGISKNTGRWRRVGDSIEVQLTTRFNADVNSGEYLTWGLPDGVVPADYSDGIVVGAGEVSTAAAPAPCAVTLGSTQAVIYLDCSGGTLTRSQIGVAPKPSFASLSFTLPVKGWTVSGP